MQESKITIITFLSNNYGTCLQAFAMKKAVETATGGGNIEFVRFERRGNASKQTSLIGRVLAVLRTHTLKELIRYRQYKRIVGERNGRFGEFKRKVSSGGKTFHNIEELRNYGNSLTASDTIVCGSDMIWSAEFSRYHDAYMLTWTGNARKVSYAPSIGNLDISASMQQRYAEALRSFDNISCRERSGADFLQRLLGRDVRVVLDPTLLFNSKQWNQWFPPKTAGEERPYILVYCFGGISKNMRSHLATISTRHSMDVRYILSPSVQDTIGELRYGNGAYGPEEYVQLFSNASFTVINGYHGLCFSLIFEKPFVLLHRDKKEHWGNHENRMGEILNLLNLQERYIEPDAEISEDHLSLDYERVRPIIDAMRTESWTYLKEALS